MQGKDVLSKEERRQIFKLFTYEHRLRFSEIGKHLNIRSNMVSYHLDHMVKSGILQKDEEYYVLTQEAEKYIPVVDLSDNMGPLPVALCGIVDGDRVLLIKRNNRPYKDHYALAGGKIRFGESLMQASSRIAASKAKVSARFCGLKCVMNESVKDKSIKHNFILFFVKMKFLKGDLKFSSHGKLQWFNLDELDEIKIIPSDRYLIKNCLDSRLKYKEIEMTDDENELKDFRVLK